MSLLIPFINELHDLGLHVLFGSKIGDPKPLALENAEPLFDLIHP
jgi:hypothetical protein